MSHDLQPAEPNREFLPPAKLLPDSSAPPIPELPDPSGDPVAVSSSDWAVAATNVLAVAGLAAGALMCSGVFLTPCVGATRSARIRSDSRRAEVEQAVSEVEGQRSTSGPCQTNSEAIRKVRSHD